MSKITPFQDYILIEPKKEENITKGGIVLPENRNRPKMYEEAEIIDVGEGIKDLDGKLIPMDVKKGQIILFIRGGSAVEIEDKLLIKQRNIIAIKK